MAYKVVRNVDGDVVCFGPDTDQYEPTLKAGDVLVVEGDIPAILVTAYEIQAAKTRQIESLDWALLSDADLSSAELAKFITHRAKIRAVPTTPRPRADLMFPVAAFDTNRNGR